MDSRELNNVPSDVRNFVIRYIDSIEQIKILLLLREKPAKQWSTEELTSELRSSTLGVEKRLRDLYDRKVLRHEANANRHSFTPASAEIGRQIDALAQYNVTYPYRVIELIYSRQEEALRVFADAFKFKKEK